MKTINFFLITAILGFFITSTVAQNNQSITLVSSIQMDKIAYLDFQPEGDLTVSHWDHEHAKMEVYISAPGFKRSQLKVLVPLGFFRLKRETYGHIASLAMPNLDKLITIGGKEFKAQLTFHLTLPRSTQLQQISIASEAIATAHVNQ